MEPQKQQFQPQKLPLALWLKLERPLLIVCLCLIGAYGLLLSSKLKLLPSSTESSLQCQEMAQPQQLSRQQLAQLLSVPERSQRRYVQEVLKAPYCRLSSLNIRAGATTERDVYRLAFDPQTDLIVLYEGQSYVGYGFKHSRK